MSKGNEPAFPIEETHWDEHGSEYPQINFGLTKREYFAGLFVQAQVSNTGLRPDITNEELAEAAVHMADALLKELEK
jgi:hypothetical protein